VSVLDFEADTLKTPPYHGTYLDQMVGKFAVRSLSWAGAGQST